MAYIQCFNCKSHIPIQDLVLGVEEVIYFMANVGEDFFQNLSCSRASGVRIRDIFCPECDTKLCSLNSKSPIVRYDNNLSVSDEEVLQAVEQLLKLENITIFMEDNNNGTQ